MRRGEFANTLTRAQPGEIEASPSGLRDPGHDSANGHSVLAEPRPEESANAFEPPSNENTNVWPDEAAEAAFLSETRGTSVSVAPAVQPAVDEEPKGPLPKLDELVNRIPAESRELLDELFRAKFTTVRRIKASDLKS